MLEKRKKQISGDNSINIQAENVNMGLSYLEARQIAMDVFESNFYKLSERAAYEAKERAEQLVDKYLNRLEEEAPASLIETQNPDMQYAVFTAQREFARSGDNELGDLLVRLLVDRSKEDKRSLIQIALNESLAVAPKLLPDQLDVLSLVFLLKYTQNHGIDSLENLGLYIDKYILPFIGNLNSKRSTYQHLEFASCGNIAITQNKIENIYLATYTGLFFKGYSKERFEPITEKMQDLIIPCLQNKEMYQIASINEEMLDKLLQERKISVEDSNRLKSLYNEGKMSDVEVKECLLNLRPDLNSLFDVWENSHMKSLTLTSVGIAIAHANIQRKIGEQFNLSIWI